VGVDPSDFKAIPKRLRFHRRGIDGRLGVVLDPDFFVIASAACGHAALAELSIFSVLFHSGACATSGVYL
jgi:hypothetical protein